MANSNNEEVDSNISPNTKLKKSMIRVLKQPLNGYFISSYLFILQVK